MEIKITVDAPGLVQAIENLAAALANQPIVPLPVSITTTEEQKVSQEKASAKKETKPEDTKAEEPVEEKVEELEEKTKGDAPEITLVTVRAYLQKLQDAGRQKDAKAILTDLGHRKLSDVPAEDYQTIIDKVEELLA